MSRSAPIDRASPELPYAEASDDELLDAWTAGDRRAGEQLVDRYVSVVTDFLRHRRADELEDVTQATFLACVENRRCFRGDASFKTYLLAIASRQLAMRSRKAIRREHALTRSPSIPQSGPLPSRVAELQEELVVLERALEDLSPDLRELLRRYYWQDQSVADIAAQLRIPAGTVKSRLSRIRALLREHIGEIYEATQGRSTRAVSTKITR